MTILRCSRLRPSFSQYLRVALRFMIANDNAYIVYLEKFPLQKNRLKILRRSVVYNRVNHGNVRNILSVRERRSVNVSGEGNGWEGTGKVSCPK